MLCLQTPGNGEDFYRDASEPTEQDGPAGPVDFDRVRESARRTHAIGSSGRRRSDQGDYGVSESRLTTIASCVVRAITTTASSDGDGFSSRCGT
jgi:hypothetical protein